MMSQYQFSQKGFASASHECLCFGSSQTEAQFFLRRQRSFNQKNSSPSSTFKHQPPPLLLVKKNSKHSLKKVRQIIGLNQINRRKKGKLEENHEGRNTERIYTSPIQCFKEPQWKGQHLQIKLQNMRFVETHPAHPYALAKVKGSQIIPPPSLRFNSPTHNLKKSQPLMPPPSPRITFKHIAESPQQSPQSCQTISDYHEFLPLNKQASYGSSHTTLNDQIQIRVESPHAKQANQWNTDQKTERSQARGQEIPEPSVYQQNQFLGVTGSLLAKSFIRGEVLKSQIGDPKRSQLEVGRSRIGDTSRSRINETNRSQMRKGGKTAVCRLKESRLGLRKMDDVEEIRSMIDQDQQYSSDQQSVVLGRLHEYGSALNPQLGQPSLQSKMLSIGTQPSMMRGSSFNYSFK